VKTRILVVDDEESLRYTFRTFLEEAGYEVVEAKAFFEAVKVLREEHVDLVFADIMLGGFRGIDLLKELKALGLRCPVIIITGYPEIATAAEAVRLGAFDYVPKPVKQDDILRLANVALQHKALIEEKEDLRHNLEAIFRSVKDGIISVDKDMNVIELNEQAARICGYSREDAIGRPLSSLPSGCDKKCLDAIRQTVRTKLPAEIPRLECRHTGRPAQVVSITTSPLDDGKDPSGGVIVIRDETRFVRLEQDLHERRKFHNLIGVSGPMQKIYSLIEYVADYPTTVLVRGESGTGKELVAEAIHMKGVRASKPLIKVNCSALPEGLLETELFGHVKGAFTGAVKDKTGRFELANGGTIFLDEIGDITPAVQHRLLRFLQEKEIERVGDPRPIRLDVRVIAATNRNLLDKVASGEFREDLYYRLKVIEIELPPLKERGDDVLLLADHFIEKFNEKLNKRIKAVSRKAQEAFLSYPWPGNVRELEHAMEHAFIVCRGDTIEVSHLPSEIVEGVPAINGTDSNDIDSPCIMDALKRAGGNKAKAARLLGISRRTLYRKIEEFGIEAKDLP